MPFPLRLRGEVKILSVSPTSRPDVSDEIITWEDRPDAKVYSTRQRASSKDLNLTATLGHVQASTATEAGEVGKRGAHPLSRADAAGPAAAQDASKIFSFEDDMHMYCLFPRGLGLAPYTRLLFFNSKIGSRPQRRSEKGGKEKGSSAAPLQSASLARVPGAYEPGRSKPFSALLAVPECPR